MEIASKLTETLYVASRTGLDSTGKPTYAAARAMACRAERTKGVGQNGAQGTADASSFTVVTTEAILSTDRVWLPGTSTGDASAARVPGPTGVQPGVRLRGSTTIFYQTVL